MISRSASTGKPWTSQACFDEARGLAAWVSPRRRRSDFLFAQSAIFLGEGGEARAGWFFRVRETGHCGAMKTKNQFLGLLREFLTAVGALAFAAFSGTEAVIGLLVAIAAVIWSLVQHEGRDLLKSSLRKALSALPGGLLAVGWVEPETAGQITAMLAPAFAAGWSIWDNGEGDGGLAGPAALAMFWIMAAAGAMTLTSCAVSLGADGKPRVSLDPAAVRANDAREILNDK